MASEATNSRLLARACVIAQALTLSDSRLFQSIQSLTDKLLEEAAGGATIANPTLPISTWLAIIDEIKDRRPRNYSRLIADDTNERLLDVWDKFGQQVSHLSQCVSDLQTTVDRLNKNQGGG